jgi:hypothetical protein
MFQRGYLVGDLAWLVVLTCLVMGATWGMVWGFSPLA